MDRFPILTCPVCGEKTLRLESCEISTVLSRFPRQQAKFTAICPRCFTEVSGTTANAQALWPDPEPSCLCQQGETCQACRRCS